MEIVTWILVFIVALAILIKSAEVFTTAAEAIGLHFKIPPFIIGVTIIALGTSLPELATSIISVIRGHSEIVIGNVAGSNMANILLVVGFTATVGKTLQIDKNILGVDLPFVFGSTFLLYLFTLDGKFGYFEGIISILLLITYLSYNALSGRVVSKEGSKDISKLKYKIKKEAKKPKHLGYKYPILLVISALFLYFSADYTITSIVKLSELLQIGTELIAVSAVAIGTSLPELIVSGMAAMKGKADIAIGNVTGSNIFNILGVMGGASVAGELTIPQTMVTSTIPILIFVTILYILISMDRKITRWEGYALLLIYVGFIGVTFGFF